VQAALKGVVDNEPARFFLVFFEIDLFLLLIVVTKISNRV
jgi:hypothetical protein